MSSLRRARCGSAISSRGAGGALPSLVDGLDEDGALGFSGLGCLGLAWGFAGEFAFEVALELALSAARLDFRLGPAILLMVR